MSLFKKAEPVAKRLKMLVYGESGTGKTVTSLSFPSPFVIDGEKGTDHYGRFFNFNVLQTTDPVKLKEAINELLEDPSNAKTFVIDPLTVFIEKITANHLSRLKAKTGNVNYSLQPKDYAPIKSEVKNIIDSLLALDMNIIVTARSSTLYSQEEFMKIMGTKPDVSKEVPYLFDVVLELKRGKTKDEFIARVEKDRTNTLPEEFPYSYQSFVNYIGIDGLEREAVVFKQKEALNQNVGRTTEISFKGNTLKTAGVTAKNLEMLAELSEKLGTDVVQQKLKEDYYIDSFLDLKESEANILIKDLQQ